MTLALLLAVLLITNIPYKRSSFPQGTWKETLPLTFLFITGSIVLLQQLRSVAIPIHTDATLLLLAALITGLWFLTPVIARRYGTYPEQLLRTYPTRFLPRMQPALWTMKYAEVVLQQVCFVYLLFLILGHLPDYERRVWFTIIVSGIHVVNFFFRDARITTLICILSIPMALLFGNLLLQGYVPITLSIHLLFYIIFFGSYWFRKTVYTEEKKSIAHVQRKSPDQ